MIATIIAGWWQVILLVLVSVGAVWGIAFAIIYFLQKAKDAGVDEINAGPVKVDFEDKK
jgi:hypothetical protein